MVLHNTEFPAPEGKQGYLYDPLFLFSASSNKYNFKRGFTECLSYWCHNEPVPPGAKHSVFILLDNMKIVQSNNHSSEELLSL